MGGRNTRQNALHAGLSIQTEANQMNKAQLSLLLTSSPKCPMKAEAIELVIIDGISAYAAEKQVYGAKTNTIARLVKKVLADYRRCREVAEAL